MLPHGLQVHNTSSVSPKLRKQDCYTPADIRMGAYINVLGRDFLIHDADTFTKVCAGGCSARHCGSQTLTCACLPDLASSSKAHR